MCMSFNRLARSQGRSRRIVQVTEQLYFLHSQLRQLGLFEGASRIFGQQISKEPGDVHVAQMHPFHLSWSKNLDIRLSRIRFPELWTVRPTNPGFLSRRRLIKQLNKSQSACGWKVTYFCFGSCPSCSDHDCSDC